MDWLLPRVWDKRCYLKIIVMCIYRMEQHLCDSSGIECSFSISTNPSDGAVGKKSIHQFFAEIVVYQTTAVQF